LDVQDNDYFFWLHSSIYLTEVLTTPSVHATPVLQMDLTTARDPPNFSLF